MRHAILLASLISSTAHAGGIVLESYTQGRPADADKYVNAMVSVMSKNGFDAGTTVGHKLENDVSRPAIVKQGLPLDYDKQLAAGMDLYVHGKFHDAVTALGPLIEIAHANPGAFATHAPALANVQRAMVMLALAEDGDGDKSAATTTFAEIMRSFPNERVSAGTFGQAANKLFQQAQADVRGRGKLIVASANPNGVIWVDEQFGAVQKVTRDNLVPGAYRVFVQTGSSVSRAHEINVVANQDTSVTIDGDFDQFVETTDYVGLRFPSDDVREKTESDAAAKFGNAIAADQIVVIGVENIQGVQSVAGSLISKTSGKRLRKGSVPLPSASPDQLKQLALYVIGQGAAGGGIKVIGDEPIVTAHKDAKIGPDDHTPIDRGHVSHSHRWGGYAWIASGGALAAIGAGSYVLSLDGKCPVVVAAGMHCKDVYSTKVPGGITVGAGVGLAVLAIYLFVTGGGGDDPGPAQGAFVVPAQGGAMAGYSLRF